MSSKESVDGAPRFPNAFSYDGVVVDVGVYALFYRSGLAFSRYFERGGDGMMVRGPVGAEESGFSSD